MTNSSKVIVLGGGPGGYAAAFLAADLGLEVTLVEKRINPGGVCLFEGCIPSKALLHAAEILNEAEHAKEFGITFEKPQLDLDKLRSWKNKVVTQLTGGLGQLAKAKKVNFVQGTGSLKDAQTLEVTTDTGDTQEIRFEYLVLATGSRPIELPFLPKSPKVLDSTGALDLEDIPKRLLVLGGGYIGLEMATVYAALGSAVTVVEMLPNLIATADQDLVKPLHKRLKKQLANIYLKTKVTKAVEEGDELKVTFEKEDGSTFEESFDKILVSVGRRPNTENIGLENTKIEMDGPFVKTDLQCRTTEPSIFAIGDVAGQPMLAHKASHEGRTAVEVIAGHKVTFEPYAIPAVVFTDPEIAWCGLTETEAKEQGKNVEVVKFPWAASGRALTLDRTEGLTKMIIDPETERILGVGIVGKGAGELIAEGTLAIEMAAVASDVKLTIHAHPTTSETVMETAEVFFGQSTHLHRPKKKK